MERAMKRSQIACIDFLNITIEIRRHPRRTPRMEARIERAARRAQLMRAVERDRDTALLHLLAHD